MGTGIYEIDDNVVSHFVLRELSRNEVEARDKEKIESKRISEAASNSSKYYSASNCFDNDIVIDDFFNCEFCGKTNKKTIEMTEALHFLIKDGLDAAIDVHCSNCKSEIKISA